MIVHYEKKNESYEPIVLNNKMNLSRVLAAKT